MQFISSTSAVSLSLIPLLVAMPVWAQVDAPAAVATQGSLQLRVVDSDGAQVPAGSRSVRGFSVLVTDGAGSAIPDAAVALRLPDGGATGLFADGSHSAVAYTDRGGHARFEGIQWSSAAGAMAIRITATKGNEHAGLLLEQSLLGGSVLTVGAPRLDIAPASSAPRTNAPAEEPSELNSIPAHLDESPVLRPITNAAAAAPGISVITDSKISPLLRASSPSVSVSHDGPSYHGSYRKWVYIGLGVAAAAGAFFAFSSLGKGAASTSTSSSPISIGVPTVSIGHP